MRISIYSVAFNNFLARVLIAAYNLTTWSIPRIRFSEVSAGGIDFILLKSASTISINASAVKLLLCKTTNVMAIYHLYLLYIRYLARYNLMFTKIKSWKLLLWHEKMKRQFCMLGSFCCFSMKVFSVSKGCFVLLIDDSFVKWMVDIICNFIKIFLT